MPTLIAENFRFSPWVIPLLTVAPLILLFGLFVFVQNIRSPTHIMFFTLTVAMNLWFLGWALVTLSRGADQALFFYRTIVFLGVSFLSTVVYGFSVLWLDLYRKQKFWVILGLAGSVIFYLINILTPYSYAGMKQHYWGYFPKYGIANLWFILFFYAYYTAAFTNFAYAYFKEKETQRKKQIGLISFAFVIALTASVDFLPKFFDTSLYPIGYVSIFLWVAMVSYAIVSYKAMDIETVLHKTLLWFASTVLTILPFAYVFHVSQTWVQNLPGFAKTTYYLVLFVSFYFYFHAVQPFLSHLFRRKRSNLSKVVARFSSELVHLQNLRDLLKRFVRLLQRTVYSTEISVLLKDEQEQQFVPVIAKGARGLNKVPEDHPFLTWTERRDQIVIATMAQVNPETQDFRNDMKSYFEEMHADVVVPFVLGGKLIGILHLGKKENLRRYSAGEINFLAQLKHPMTIAFANSKQLEDISRLYKQVQSQNERLKELDRLKSEFLANTSHELRTPLNGILGLVESILDGSDGPLNETQHKHLQMIIESGTNLKELINNLLELSRIEAGQEEFNFKHFNIINVIDAVITLTDNLAKKKKIKLSRISSASVPDVCGDPAKIQRVMMNLIGNAIKFTEKGSVTVRVNEEGGRVRIAVEDTGVGIPESQQKIIFERFRQVDGSATRRFEGSGLGLSIAKEIVERHGDEIRVKSEAGKGSVFSFHLSEQPLLEQQSQKRTAPVSDLRGKVAQIQQDQKEFQGAGFDKEYKLIKDAEYAEAIRGQGEKILIIDDNEVNREVVKTRLELNNYKAVEAVDGLDGLEKFEQEKPDLVILDLMMPKMSGYEFCKRLREQHKLDEIPVIMLTAKTEMGDKIYGLSLGANDYISKPFNKEELIARVSILLKIRQMTRELKKWNETLETRVEERTEELIKTQQQLIQAEKMATIGTMAGGVAHEINNPLTAVLTNAQILKTMGSYDPEMIDLIEQGAKRCQIIIQKLMKYTRKTPEEASFEKIDLNAVIRNVVSMLSYQFEQENIKVEAAMNGDVWIRGKANELEQVFTNLLVNARDAIRSKSEKGKIDVAVNACNGFAEVRVQDNGIGIPEEIINKIFDPFFTTKEVGSGTGLGLSISYGIVQRHQGKIRVESLDKQGTTFILRFPILLDELAKA